MKESDEISYVLTNLCPQCGGHLFTWRRALVRGLPLADVWSVVECDNVDYDYVYPEQFATLEDLAKSFQARIK